MAEKYRKLKFKAAVHYRKELVEIGRTVEVDESWAKNFIAQGVAEEVVENDELTEQSLSKLRKDDLIAKAVEMGIEVVPDAATKTDIIGLILAKK